MNYYTIYPKLPSAAKMYLEGSAATCQWWQGLLFFKPESVNADWLQ
jgi:hypothetical protein